MPIPPRDVRRQFTRGRSLVLASIIVSGLLLVAESLLRLVGVAPAARPVLVVRSVDVDIDFPFMRPDSELF